MIRITLTYIKIALIHSRINTSQTILTNFKQNLRFLLFSLPCNTEEREEDAPVSRHLPALPILNHYNSKCLRELFLISFICFRVSEIPSYDLSEPPEQMPVHSIHDPVDHLHTDSAAGHLRHSAERHVINK